MRLAHERVELNNPSVAPPGDGTASAGGGYG